jgi:hypothetical protein
MVDSADKDGAWATIQLLPDQIMIEGVGDVTSRTLVTTSEIVEEPLKKKKH